MRWSFVMDDDSQYEVIAPDFKRACLAWENFGENPEEIKEIQRHDYTDRREFEPT